MAVFALFAAQVVIGQDMTAEPEIDTVTMETLALPGDNVTYECRIKNLRFGSIVNTFKGVIREDGGHSRVSTGERGGQGAGQG